MHPACLLLTLALLGCASPDEMPAQADTGTLHTWARRQLGAGRLTQATEGFRRVLMQDSLHVGALSSLATIYQMQGRAVAADRYRRRAFHIHYSRGLDWLESDRVDSARAAFEQALQVMPDHPLAHLRLGELDQAAGRLDHAIARFERAVAANPAYSRGSVILGRALARAGQADRARQAFESAIDVNINALDAYLGLGDLFAQQSRWPEAVAQYEKALLVDPRSEAALRGLEQARARL